MRGTLPTRRGAEPYYTRPLDGITGVTIHYTAGSARASVENIAAYQTGPSSHLDFPAIAYHVVVELSGAAYLCHDLDVRCWYNGAVVGGVARNRSHVGVCWTGNDRPTPAQIDGMARAIVWCEAQLGRVLAVEGHRDHDQTTCPGDAWPQWRGDLLAVVAACRHP